MFNKKIASEFAIGIVLLIVIVVGGIFYLQNKKVSTNDNQQKACTMEAKLCDDGSYVSRTGPNCEFTLCPENKTSQMANPASVYCIENGGKSEIKTSPDGGQTGYCKFDDGSECEEWAYFRKECSAGNSNAAIDTSNWQAYNSKNLGNSYLKFEFKYPKNWKVIEGPNLLEIHTGDFLSSEIQLGTINLLSGLADTLEKYFNQQDKKYIKISMGNSSYEYYKSEYLQYPDPNNKSYMIRHVNYIVSLDKNHTTYFDEIFPGSSNALCSGENCDAIMDNILSTFSFIK